LEYEEIVNDELAQGKEDQGMIDKVDFEVKINSLVCNIRAYARSIKDKLKQSKEANESFLISNLEGE